MKTMPTTEAPADQALPPSSLPAEAPMEMPVQSLRHGRLTNQSLPSTPSGMGWRRCYVIGGTGLLTLLAAYQIWWVLRGDGINVL
jgi:membrane glycosyltransferase